MHNRGSKGSIIHSEHLLKSVRTLGIRTVAHQSNSQQNSGMVSSGYFLCCSRHVKNVSFPMAKLNHHFNMYCITVKLITNAVHTKSSTNVPTNKNQLKFTSQLLLLWPLLLHCYCCCCYYNNYSFQLTAWLRSHYSRLGHSMANRLGLLGRNFNSLCPSNFPTYSGKALNGNNFLQ